MHIGAVFPQTEIGTDPGAIREFAQAMEQMGYRHLQVYDHVIGADTSVRPGWDEPYALDDEFHEVFVLYGFLAAVTRSIELVIGVLILPQRQTVLVAKQAAALDVLSGGRLRLGVGIGWNAVEYQALGEDWQTRGVRSEEQIAVMRALWTEKSVTFDGKWHTIEAAGINPLPVQRPIPLWIGGGADAVLRRSARLADGWISSGDPNDVTRRKIAALHGYLAEAGRGIDGFGIDGHLTLSDTTEDRWSDIANEWREMGATHLSVQTMGAGYATVDQHIEAFRRVSDALGIAKPATA